MNTDEWIRQAHQPHRLKNDKGYPHTLRNKTMDFLMKMRILKNYPIYALCPSLVIFNYFYIVKSLLIFFFFSISIFGIDEYFQFPSQTLPEKVEYEKSRKLCLFPFRNKVENEKFQYLSKGIPSVIISNLNGFKYVFDPEVLETVIYHAFGEQSNEPPAKKGKPPINRKVLNDLNSGAKDALPEKDPRYIKLDVALISMETPPLLESNLEIGRKNKCFYVITGEYIVSGEDALTINLEFTNRKNGNVEKMSESTSLRRAYQEMNSIGFKVKKMLFNKEMATIQIETGEEIDALVFIDGHYAGKTPLDKSDVAAGQHAITITKEGFETLNRVVNLKKESVSKYAFALKKLEKKGTISVRTNPEGASVYLGITYLGESPLTNIVVPLGQNRLRIEKEDHIDYFAGVEVEQGKPLTVNANLKKGKTEDYYKNRLKVFLDYTYFDFSQYSVYSVVLFYASYQYWNYRINVQRDSIRGDPYQNGVVGSLTLFTTYQNYFSGTNANSISNLFVFNEYQKGIVASNEKQVTEFRGYRDASAAGALSMLVLAGVFYYLGVDNDAFEFAFIPPRINNTSNGIYQPSVESYAKFNFRF